MYLHYLSLLFFSLLFIATQFGRGTFLRTLVYEGCGAADEASLLLFMEHWTE